MLKTFFKRMRLITPLAIVTIFLFLMIFSATASAAILGDVNNDGLINIQDVALVQRHIMGFAPPLTTVQKIAADVNYDGFINILDVTLIAQMSLGLINEYPVLTTPVLSSPADNIFIAATSIIFQWNPSSGANKYELEVTRVSDGVVFKNPILGYVTSTTQYSFPNDDTQFRWRVRAGNDNAWSSWSAFRYFVNGSAPAGQTTPPPAVSLPAAPVLTVPAAGTSEAITTISGSSISFQWYPSSGANKYELMVTKVSDGSPYRTQVLGDQTYSTQIGFPNDGSQFRWKARAGNAAGWGSWSAERTFTNSGTIGVPLLTSPAANANVFGSAVTFRWNAASGATRYKLELYKAGATTPIWSQELGNVTTASFIGLANDGAAYRWRVQAGNISTWSGTWSVEQTFSNGLMPAEPTLTSPGKIESVTPKEVAAGSSISFRWTAPTGAGIDKYNLEIVRVRDGLVLKNLILGNTTVSLQVGFPDDGTEYKWRVRAGSKDGWGPWPSAYFHFINGELDAPILTYPANNANIASSRITFEWKPVAGATKYRLVITDGTNTFTDVTLGSVYASIQRDFPNDGTAYTWAVYAGNRDGNWSPAASRTFTNGSSLAVPLQLAPVVNAAVSPADATYSVDFSWSAVSDATKYRLAVMNARNGSVFADEEVVIVSPATATYATENLPGFVDGEQYKWRVRAGKSTADWGTWSPYRDFIYYYETPVLTAPSLLSPATYATVASETVQFRWTTVISAASYHLQVRRVGNGELFFEDVSISPAEATYSATDFPNDSTQFMWRVRANDDGAWSLYQYFTNGFWWNLW